MVFQGYRLVQTTVVCTTSTHRCQLAHPNSQPKQTTHRIDRRPVSHRNSTNNRPTTRYSMHAPGMHYHGMMHHCTVEYSSGVVIACVVCRSALGPVVVWERLSLRGRKGLAQSRSLARGLARTRQQVQGPESGTPAKSIHCADGQAISPPSTGGNTNNCDSTVVIIRQADMVRIPTDYDALRTRTTTIPSTAGRTVQVLHRVRRTPRARQHVLQLQAAHSTPRKRRHNQG